MKKSMCACCVMLIVLILTAGGTGNALATSALRLDSYKGGWYFGIAYGESVHVIVAILSEPEAEEDAQTDEESAETNTIDSDEEIPLLDVRDNTEDCDDSDQAEWAVSEVAVGADNSTPVVKEGADAFAGTGVVIPRESEQSDESPKPVVKISDD